MEGMELSVAPDAPNHRMQWRDLPNRIVAEIEAMAGGTVAHARDQRGGYSPGLAARLVLKDGRRLFVKAVSAEVNADSPGLYRHEIPVLQALPSTLRAPQLRGVFDDGNWVAILLDDVEGTTPALPWTDADLQRLLTLHRDMSRDLTPSPLALPTIAQHHAKVFSSWRNMLETPPDALDPWSLRHLGVLAHSEANWEAAVEGSTLNHSDIRADNLLVDPVGDMWIVDWGSACVGAPWFDLVAFAPNVAECGGPGPSEFLSRAHPDVVPDADHLLPVVVALAGYFTLRGLSPPPAGMPTLRAHQTACGAIMRSWVEELTGWR